MKDRVERLRGFRFQRHPHYNLPTDRLRVLEDFLQKRIDEILNYNGKQAGLSSISVGDCTIKNKNFNQDCTKNNSDSKVLSEAIKENLKADPFVTTDELAEILQLSRRTVSSELKRLSEIKAIERLGSRKTGYWKVL